jgi:hypothetical protein
MKTTIFTTAMLLVSCLFPTKTNAQTKLDPLTKVGIQTVGGVSTGSNVFTQFDERYEGLKGTHYFIPTWLGADLFSESGQLLRKNVPVKFDIYNNELVMLKPDGDSVAVYPASFIINDEPFDSKYQFVKSPNLISKSGKDLSDSYVLVLYKGKNKLFKYLKKNFVKADYKQPYGENRPYDSFEDRSEYFLVKENGKVSRIKAQKSQVIKDLGRNQDKVEAYIKTNKLDLKSDSAIVSALAYFETLNNNQ